MGVVADFDAAAFAITGPEAYGDMILRRLDVRIDQVLAAAAGLAPVFEVRPWPPTGYFAGGAWTPFLGRCNRKAGQRL